MPSPRENAIWARYTPLIEAARKNESEQLEAAFFDEVPRLIDGIPCRVMTLRDFLAHRVAGSPFVVGGAIAAAHILQFVWVQSVAFKPGDAKARDKWTECVLRRHLLASMEAAIRLFLKNTFMLAGGRNGGGAQGEPIRLSQAALLIDLLAHEYGWTPSVIMSLPLQQIFQLNRLIENRRYAEAGKTAPAFFGESDELFSRALEELNTPEK